MDRWVQIIQINLVLKNYIAVNKSFCSVQIIQINLVLKNSKERPGARIYVQIIQINLVLKNTGVARHEYIQFK